jgi:hypothetical protein
VLTAENVLMREHSYSFQRPQGLMPLEPSSYSKISKIVRINGSRTITVRIDRMSGLLKALSLASILIQSDSFRTVSLRHNGVIPNKRVTELADFSALHDSGLFSSSIDSFHHMLNGMSSTDVTALHNTLNIADADIAPVTSVAETSIYKVDKTGFIGTCADVLERAIDLSHDLMQKLGVKDTYGYSIILLTIFSKFHDSDSNVPLLRTNT